jgi:hypothetical protein
MDDTVATHTIGQSVFKDMPKKYSSQAQKYVRDAMHKRKRGTLKSGGSGKIVRSRKQAIAIGLSEARRKGARVPQRR